MRFQLTTVFRISIYLLVSVASGILAVAEGTFVPAGISIPLAVAALFANEFTSLIRISAAWANGLGVLALVLTGLEYMEDNPESRLVAGAHLLIYLTWIVMFQSKRPKQYWWMCALSILEVGVASVLTESLGFGLMLVLYLFLSVWTLSLLCLYQATREFSGDFVDGATLATGKSEGGIPAAVPSSILGRSAADRQREFHASTRRTASAVAAASFLDANEHNTDVSARFVAGTFGVSLGALGIGAIFFLLIPRLWIGNWSRFSAMPRLMTRPMTGFTEEVQLGDMGQILESSEKVLDVRLFDNDTGNEINVMEYAHRLGYDEPLFRGSVLERYKDGRWSLGYEFRRYPPRHMIYREPGLIRQEYRSQALGTRILFAMHPIVGSEILGADVWISQHPTSGVMVLHGMSSEFSPIDYVAYSPRVVRPLSLPPLATYTQPLLGLDTLARCMSLPEHGLERLKALARQIVLSQASNDHLEQLTPRQMAMAVVSYLRDSNNFAYSLDLSIQDPEVDPLEDFLFNRKQGHCEYFASALVLMLRSLGIPARLVSGFKGGTFNAASRRFEVQQRHAHAWAEAFLDYRWVVLDATPASRADSVNAFASEVGRWGSAKRILREAWFKYVANVSYIQQEQQVYNPLLRSAKSTWTFLKSVDWVSGAKFRVVIDFLKSPKKWFSWQGGIGAFVLMLGASGIIWAINRLYAIAKRFRFALRTRRFRDRVSVDFYDRFQRVVRKAGLVRESPQTHWEFAKRVEHRLGAVLVPAGLTSVPSNVIKAFYRVRFGGERLEEIRIEEINRLLTQLEECLASSKQKRR